MRAPIGMYEKHYTADRSLTQMHVPRAAGASRGMSRGAGALCRQANPQTGTSAAAAAPRQAAPLPTPRTTAAKQLGVLASKPPSSALSRKLPAAAPAGSKPAAAKRRVTIDDSGSEAEASSSSSDSECEDEGSSGSESGEEGGSDAGASEGEEQLASLHLAVEKGQLLAPPLQPPPPQASCVPLADASNTLAARLQQPPPEQQGKQAGGKQRSGSRLSLMTQLKRARMEVQQQQPAAPEHDGSNDDFM